MSQLTFPAQPDGLFVDVLVGLDGTTTASLHAAGLTILQPVRARGAIDTGSDVSGVSAAILHRLGIQAHQLASVQTVAGAVSVSLYKVSLGVTDFREPHAPELVEPNLLALKLPTALPLVEVLVGLDVLMGCKLLLDGPSKKFVLEF